MEQLTPFANKQNIDKEKLQRMLPKGSNHKVTDEIINMISKTGAVRIARKKFDYYLEKAKEVADSIKGADRRACLVKICDSINMEV